MESSMFPDATKSIQDAKFNAFIATGDKTLVFHIKEIIAKKERLLFELASVEKDLKEAKKLLKDV